MTPVPAGGGPGEPSRWKRELTLVALSPDGPGTLGDLARVLGRATSAQGVVLWEARSGPDGCTWASMLARWLDPPLPPGSRHPVSPDPVTDHALCVRSLALPTELSGVAASLFGLPIAAAMPFDYTDGATGVLTLLGAAELAEDSFDIAAELIEILPVLCGTLRERQTLALVQACDTILHDAEVESAAQPLPRERLREHLEEVCHRVAQAVEATEVAIFLQETAAADGRYPLFASSARPGGDGGPGPDPGAAARAQVAQVDGPLMELPLHSGNHMWGLIRCTRGQRSPLNFTSSDLPLVRPIATAVAQYWRSWLHRRAISAENDSWRRLAAGISKLNRLFAEELSGNAGWSAERERRFGDAALHIVQDVVPESTHLLLSRAEPAAGSTRLMPVSRVGEQPRLPPAVPGPTLAEQVLHTHSQLWVNEPEELVREWADPETGWLVCTPVGVGNRIYGVLQATGPTGELPANSAQACEIVADQLGLYRHVEEAWQVLRAGMRSQAETMEDLKHQLASPLRTATDRTELVIRHGRFDTRTEAQLKAVRGLCRKARRVAMSAGVFAALSRGERPPPKTELLGVDDLLRLLIAGADDTQVLSNPAQRITFDVDRDSVRRLGRRLVDVDISFLQQCIGNVLDNAGKYGYKGTCVRIGATVSGDHFAIEVTSTGVRLDPNDTTRCLQRNWRGEVARTNTGEGSGIGLWIVDHLMRSMSGTVQLCPAADTTTVRLVLPLV